MDLSVKGQLICQMKCAKSTILEIENFEKHCDFRNQGRGVKMTHSALLVFPGLNSSVVVLII